MAYDQKACLQQHIAQNLARHIKCVNPKRILEIGCGTGFLTRLMRDKYPQARIDVTDIAPEMIAYTKAKFVADPLMSFFVMDAQEAGHKQGYDLIVTSMTAQWFENPEKTLCDLSRMAPVYFATLGPDNFQEWRKTLKNLSLPFGGRILETLPGVFNDEYPKQEIQNAMQFLKSVKEIGAHTAHKDYQELSAGELRQAMRYFDAHFSSITWHIVYGCLTQQA